jgi:hypothetical protein
MLKFSDFEKTKIKISNWGTPLRCTPWGTFVVVLKSDLDDQQMVILAKGTQALVVASLSLSLSVCMCVCVCVCVSEVNYYLA